MNFSIPELTMFFAGYLDAVGRSYTTGKELYTLRASIIPSNSSLEEILNTTIIEKTEVINSIAEFEKATSGFLKTDPRERTLFYLIDYFSWFDEFTESCTCNEYRLSWDEPNPPLEYLAYTLKVNDSFDILVFFCITMK